MNWLDPIEELYGMYSKEEDTPKIAEVGDDDLDFISDIEGPVLATNHERRQCQSKGT